MNNTFLPTSSLQHNELRRHIHRLRGTQDADPNASVIIPVSALPDISQVKDLLADLARYRGSYTLEVILLVPASLVSAEEIESLQSLGLRVIPVPKDGQEMKTPRLNSRAVGVEAARAGITLHFASDVRIPDPSALLDWYIQSLYSGYQLAYSQIGFYGLPDRLGTRLSLALLNGLRGLQRTLLGVPTTRGSNYAINRSLFLKLYEAGKITEEIPIGLAVRLAEARSRYASLRRLWVYLSAPKYSPQSLFQPSHILRRLRYNLKAVPLTFHSSEWANWRALSEEQDRHEQYTPFAKENRS